MAEKKLTAEKKLQRQKLIRDILQNEQNQYKNTNLCSLCPNVANMICIPCRHKAYCNTCARENINCCICTKVITFLQPVCFS